MSSVGEEMYYTSIILQQKHEGPDGACCDRYDDHMKSYEQKAKHGMAPKQLHPENSFINRLMVGGANACTFLFCSQRVVTRSNRTPVLVQFKHIKQNSFC